MDIDRIRARIDREELVELTRALIRIDSVYRPGSGGSEAAVAAYVAGLLRDWGLAVRVQEAAPGRPNVMGILEGGRPGKTLLLEGHTDVVTEGDAAEWLVPPFEGRVVDGRIYGRGACDTKQNLAAAMLAVRAVKEAAAPFPGRILLAVPVDEEGMMQGIKAMIHWGWCDGVDGAIICEPEQNEVCVTQKGAIRALVRGRGKMAHGAMPRTGVNPIPPLARMVLRFGELEAAECARLGEDRFLGWQSVTPTIFTAPPRGEAQLNVVPSEALIALDIRTIRGQDHERLARQLAEIVAAEAARTPGFTATFEVIDDRPVTETPQTDPLVQAVCAAVRRVTGREPVWGGVPGATDGTFLRAWKGIPIVTTGSGDRYIPHQKDEYVEIDQLVEACHIYAAAAALFLSR